MRENILTESALVGLERREFAVTPKTCVVVENLVVCVTIEGPVTLEDLAGLAIPKDAVGETTLDDLLLMRNSALAQS